jgi:hypothetical protein
MLNRLFSGLDRARGRSKRRGAPAGRCRLGVERLEDRLVLATTVASAVGLQTQLLANPAASTTVQQDISAGGYQTVARQAVTVGGGQTGLYNLAFQAQAFADTPNEVRLRYLVDGRPDPNDAAITRSPTGADVTEDVSDGPGAGGWQTLWLTHQLNLSAGTHTVAVQVLCTAQGLNPGLDLTVYAPTLSLTGFAKIGSQHAADGTQTQLPSNPSGGAAGRQYISAGTYQTVASQTVTIDAGKSGLVDLAFQAQAFADRSNEARVRYLIDGQPDPEDMGISYSATGADSVETFLTGTWHTLYLTHQLQLAAGTHTITVQVYCANQGTVPGADLAVYTPVLSLIAYGTFAGQRAADGAQSQALVYPASGTPQQFQYVVPGGFQTVSSQVVTIDSAKTGLVDLAFQAQAWAPTGNRLLVRYLIDGQPDPNDLAVANSPGGADTVSDFSTGYGMGAWGTLWLTHQLTLSPGTHTVSVQVATVTLGGYATVYTPVLRLTGYNNINPATTYAPFAYNATTQTLTVSGTGGTDQFQFRQSTSLVGGAPVTTYTVTLNGASVSYTSAQLKSIVVHGNGGADTAVLDTNDTYVGADGKTHETREQVALSPAGGVLRKYDAHNNPVAFLQLSGVNNIYAYMGHADTGLMSGSAGNDSFVSAGYYAYMSGPGYYNLISGAQSVVATAGQGGNDQAIQYDGSGPSTYTASGTAYSLMTGTDHGQSFSNKAVGFANTYGVALHPSQDVAYLYDSPGSDTFVGATSYSYLYRYDNGILAMLDEVLGFNRVYATSSAGGTDLAYVFDAVVNTVSGFQRIV